MSYDNKDAQAQIEDLYCKKLISCSFERDFVLRATFKDRTDVGEILRPSYFTEGFLYNQDLFSLSQEIPLIIFDNATLNRQPTTPISASKDDNNILRQDPFHYDFFGVDQVDRNKSTFLFKQEGVSRGAPTYFALPKDVKLAVSKMEPLGISEDLRMALLEMDQDGFSFSLELKEIGIRDRVIDQYPSFTDDVYAAIPQGSKFEHYWQSGTYTVTLHANDGEKLLHARGASKNDYKNQVMICDFYDM